MKRALIVGCGERVWQDVDEAMALCEWDGFYVCKLAGVHWQHEGHFVWPTLHPEFMDDFEKQRRERGLHQNYEIVAPLQTEVGRHNWITKFRRTSFRFKGMTASGSSGLFAVKIAIEDGYDRLVLAGMPMTKDPHFSRRDQFGKPVPWKQRDSFLRGWEVARSHYKDKTRSISGGWTEETLGRPTLEWLGLDGSQVAADAERESAPAVT